MISLRHIEKKFESGLTAVENFSLSLADGEFVSLIGPSGCGKSTVLSMLAGLTTPSGGEIDGRKARPGATAFVFQEPTLMPWATIARNIALPLELSGRTGDIDGLLGKVGLGQFGGAYPRQLSGGMKMRASIARALAGAPELLLLDEPFAALDEITRFDLIGQLLALWRERAFTALFVTHSIGESVFMSQRIVVMSPRPGRIVGEITIDEPYPRSPDFRATARYAAWCGEVLHCLQQSMATP
jgi:NitT/TauT family transport system ATP-binding protein